jgi:hypothetical protein
MRSALLLVLSAATAGAQTRTVSVRGLAYDSLHGKPLAGAFVGIAGTSLSAISDEQGRFTFAAVAPGAHRIVMQHDALDAVGLTAAGARANVTDGNDVVVVAVPSFATLWRAACGSTPPGIDTGFVFGTVRRGSTPVPKAIVSVSWIDLFQDSTKAVRQKQKVMEVDADSLGNYAACGVPTTTGLSARAASDPLYGVWVDIAPMDRERIARRDLSLPGFFSSLLRPAGLK